MALKCAVTVQEFEVEECSTSEMISPPCLCTLGAASARIATELKDVFLLSNDGVTLKSVIAQLWQKRRIYGTKKDV